MAGLKMEATDINALRLLDDQIEVLKNIPRPSVLEKNNEKISKISLLLTKVKDCVTKVTEYIASITTKLEDMRDLIKEYDVDVADNLEAIVKMHLIPDTKSNVQSPNTTRDNIAEKRLKHFRGMQRLARQDHELKEFIAKTEDVILKSDTQAEYCIEDIHNLEENLMLWSNTLDRLEDKCSLEENEPRINESSSMSDNSGLGIDIIRENVIQSTEDLETIHENYILDYKNWPQFVYENNKTSRFQQRICCVVKAAPGSMQQDDLQCEAADSYHVLDNCLELVDEQVISALINIQPKDGKNIQFETPIFVYIPIVPHSKALIPAIKYYRGDCWAVGETATTIQVSSEPEVSFIGTSIPVRDLVCLQCIAVARHRRHELNVDESGVKYELQEDRNIKIIIPPFTFPYFTTVLTKMVAWSKSGFEQDAMHNDNLKDMKTASSYVELSCEAPTQADIEVVLYDVGLFDDKTLKKMSVNQETINRCSRWLVTNMEPVETERMKSLYEEVPAILQSKETKGDKNRMILQEIKDEDTSAYEGFFQRLKSSNQRHIVQLLNDVRKKVSEMRLQKSKKENIFDTEYQLREGHLYVLLQIGEQAWNVLLYESKPVNLKSRKITLPKGNLVYKLMCITSKKELTSEETRLATKTLDGMTYLTSVCLICRQNKEDAHNVIIQCLKSNSVHNKLQELCDRGFSDGPPPTPAFGVIDGEEIEIKFEGNIEMTKYKSFPLKIKFFANIEPLKFSGRIEILDNTKQSGEGSYHGNLMYRVMPGRFNDERTGYMEIHFQKPLEENITDFQYNSCDPVEILARHVAWQQTCDNVYSTRWITYAGYLVENNLPLYKQIIKEIDEAGGKVSQYERCKLFILKWAAEYAKPNSNKIKNILGAQTDEDKRKEAEEFIKAYQPSSGYLIQEKLQDISYAIAKEWKVISENLRLSSAEINNIVATENGLVRQALRMLDIWRLSDGVVLRSGSPITCLCDATKDLQCSEKLRNLFKYL